MKLNQVVALVTGKKAKAERMLTEAHHKLNEQMVTGHSRVYACRDEDGERLPTEQKRVRDTVVAQLAELRTFTIDYWSLVYAQEDGNTRGRADVVIDSHAVMLAVPIGFLLFLEKRLTDLLTFIRGLPVVSLDRQWTWASEKGCYESEATTTVKTAKEPKVIVLHAPTKEHPAQTQLIYVDRPVGDWTTVNFSGALGRGKKKDIEGRCERLLEAVKKAREEANSEEYGDVADPAAPVWDFIFGN